MAEPDFKPQPSNRSLLARTRPEFYADAVAIALAMGASRKKMAAQVASDIYEAQCLLEGKCPQCGAPSVRYVNYLHQGPSNMPGVWVQYRCSTQPPPGQLRPDGVCDFMIDLKEGDEAN